MIMEDRISRTINEIAGKITTAADNNYIGMKTAVRDAVDYLQIAMFPSFNGRDFAVCKTCDHPENCQANQSLNRSTQALEKACNCLVDALSRFINREEAANITQKLLLKLPEIKDILQKDIQAAYEGDPAAVSQDEVILLPFISRNKHIQNCT